MRILVTGGTGIIGEGVIPSLLRAGHEIRILSRGAEQDALQWPDRVEAFPADIADAASLRGAATGCEAIVHVTGIAKEHSPSSTFEKINVEGTANILREAERAGAQRFIYMSSLGARDGRSGYHRSKRRAEEIVRGFKRSWVILRPGKVYGPGDDVVSMLLRMVRMMPIVPVVASGDQRFQPIWYQDLGSAVTKVVEMSNLSRITIEIAGTDVTTTNDVLDRLAKLTGKEPPRVGVPTSVVAIGAKVAETLGIDLPIDPQMLTMLLEENVIDEGRPNGLVTTLGITPTPLAAGLAALADIQPEQLPGDGVGSVERKRFWADVAGAQKTASELMAAFKIEINDIMPIDFAAEPGAPETIRQGATMTAELPVRGTVQMRVEESSPRHFILATLRGHPIAGVVSFSATDRADGLRFEVVVYSQAASLPDWIMLKTAGAFAQNANWTTVVERVVALSGGMAPEGVQTEMDALDDREASDAETWIRGIILDRKREEHLGLPDADRTPGAPNSPRPA